MKIIKTRFGTPKLIGKTLDLNKAQVVDQNILLKEKVAKIADRAFKNTINRFLPKIEEAANKRLKLNELKFGQNKTKLKIKSTLVKLYVIFNPLLSVRITETISLV